MKRTMLIGFACAALVCLSMPTRAEEPQWPKRQLQFEVREELGRGESDPEELRGGATHSVLLDVVVSIVCLILPCLFL